MAPDSVSIERVALRCTVVVPTCRPERMAAWCDAWRNQLAGCRVIVVEDNVSRTLDLPAPIECYSWEEIDRELGADSWIIPRRSDCVRSFGFLRALEQPTPFVWTLDDDCLPEPDVAYVDELAALLAARHPHARWWNTIQGSGFYPRGYPYNITILHHGLWSNVPDLDAQTQSQNPDFRLAPTRRLDLVPAGQYFPMSGMNVAFRSSAIAALYFGLQGPSSRFDRFGDIWAGIIFKRIADVLCLAITSGAPPVRHDRASNTEENRLKEQAGIATNQFFWRLIDLIPVSQGTISGCYEQIAHGLASCEAAPYFPALAEAMTVWTRLVRARGLP